MKKAKKGAPNPKNRGKRRQRRGLLRSSLRSGDTETFRRYGILGLNWTYAKSAHQLLSRRHDESHLLYAFMDPVQNKFISLEVFGRMDKDNTVSVNILQNVSSSVPGQRTDYSLHVDKVEGGLVWLSSANQPTEQVILKIQ